MIAVRMLMCLNPPSDLYMALILCFPGNQAAGKVVTSILFLPPSSRWHRQVIGIPRWAIAPGSGSHEGLVGIDNTAFVTMIKS
jgi:hypothetical protein